MFQENSAEKVKVRLKVGTYEVEIEAGLDQIEEGVRRVVEALRAEEGAAVQRAVKDQERVRPQTCRQVIEKLVAEGFFAEPRALSDVTREVARRGYGFDSTAVGHVLLDLVREEKLVREGAPRRYVYVAPLMPPSADVTTSSARQASQLEPEGRAS
ncbi:MAG: hypothetical protein NZ957_03260 [Thaumarchaeota archaeon]|nr:hypothetical protein [Candidatus Calditenuaceae archaeon]MDW8042161.1 hypothetical protein [Nitrososphaerota archaeon]